MLAGPMGPGALDGADLGMGMGFSAEHELAEWIGALYAQGKRLTSIELRAKPIGGGESAVRDWAQSELMGQDPASIAGEVHAAAADDASSARTAQRYCALAYQEGDVAHCSRKFFRIEATDMDAVFDDEADRLRDGSGLVSQAHRLVEVMFRQTVAERASMTRTLIGLVNDLGDRLRDSTREQLQAVARVQEFMDRTEERKLKVRQEQLRQDRHERLMSKGEGLVFAVGIPELLRRFGIGAGAAAPQSAASPEAPGVLLTSDESARLRRLAYHLIDLLADVDDASFPPLLARVPDTGHGDVVAARGIIRSAATAGRKLTPIEAQVVAKVIPLIPGLLAATSDDEFPTMLDLLPGDVRAECTDLRRIVRERFQQATGREVSPGAAAGNSSNGAPTANGAPPAASN